MTRSEIMKARAPAFLPALLIAGCLAAPVRAQTASILFSPSGGQSNVLFRTVQTGSSVTGFLNDNSDFPVIFTSTTDVLLASGGHAKIEASDGALNNITISLPGMTFTSLVANPNGNGDAVDTGPPAGRTTSSLTVSGAILGNGPVVSDPHSLGTGQNFFEITALGANRITAVTLDSTDLDWGLGWDSLQQVRIDGIATAPLPVVPEPGALALLLPGLLPVGLTFRRRSLKR